MKGVCVCFIQFSSLKSRDLTGRRRREASTKRIGGAFAGKEGRTRVGSRQWKLTDGGRAISTDTERRTVSSLNEPLSLSRVSLVTRYEIKTLGGTSGRDKRDRKSLGGRIKDDPASIDVR